MFKIFVVPVFVYYSILIKPLRMLALIVIILIFISFKIITLLTNFRCEANTCLIGKVGIVTGGNSGIGYETVLDLASRGCKVIIADITNGEGIVAKIKEETGNQNVIWKYVDLGSLSSVREFAAQILKSETRLDILINNAGCGGCKELTKDGLQKIMHINYFGHFLLTHLLVDLLKKTPKSRVISVSSLLAFTHAIKSAKSMNAEPEFFLNLFNVMYQYGNSKLCILVAMKVMADRLRKHGIACYSVHPGIIYTPIYKTTLANSSAGSMSQTLSQIAVWIIQYFFGKTPTEGAQTTLQCALSEDVESLSGKYFCNGKVFWEPPIAYNKEFCLQIWKESEKLVHLRDEEKLV